VSNLQSSKAAIR